MKYNEFVKFMDNLNRFTNSNEIYTNEKKLIEEIIPDYEFIYEFKVPHYISGSSCKIIYHEPHFDTNLNKTLTPEISYKISAIYYDNGYRWLRLKNTRNWVNF